MVPDRNAPFMGTLSSQLGLPSILLKTHPKCLLSALAENAPPVLLRTVHSTALRILDVCTNTLLRCQRSLPSPFAINSQVRKHSENVPPENIRCLCQILCRTVNSSPQKSFAEPTGRNALHRRFLPNASVSAKNHRALNGRSSCRALTERSCLALKLAGRTLPGAKTGAEDLAHSDAPGRSLALQKGAPV